MKPIAGYNEAKPYADQEPLPVGGYVLKIAEAKEIEYGWGNVLQISFDIAEGEFKGYFAENYRNQLRDNKKWKGTFRLNLPKEDGTEQDEWTLRAFKTAMECAIEVSNPGFRWDWDEKKLKGKLVGGLFGNIQYRIEESGKEGFYVGCRSLKAVNVIREGKFKIPADKLLKGNKAAAESEIPEGFEAMSDDDMPF